MRILLISNFPRVRELGAARIHLELGEELRRQGHEVEQFSWNDAFPRPCSKLLAPFFQTRRDFANAAHGFIRKHASNFDVIDACECAVVCSPRSLGSSGLLVVRSAGLTGLYSKILGGKFNHSPTRSLRNIVGGALRKITRMRDGDIGRESFEVADLANLVNDEEEKFLRNDWQNSVRVVKLPYGMSGERLAAFRSSAASPENRLANARVVFVGSWQARKGSEDFATILLRIREQVTHARFVFLGTGVASEVIHLELGDRFRDCLEVIPKYANDDLPKLLGPCTVGMFPSYVESFGFAVLEKLASGLPTIAYHSPGPPVMLQHCAPSSLVAIGDRDSLADQVVKRLRYSVVDYEAESKHSTEVAARFDWRQVASKTIEIYNSMLDRQSRPDHVDTMPLRLD